MGAGRFLLRRFWRIYPAYWIALSALLVADRLVLDRRYFGPATSSCIPRDPRVVRRRLALSINDAFWFITLILSLYLLFAVLRRFLGRPDQLLLSGLPRFARPGGGRLPRAPADRL